MFSEYYMFAYIHVYITLPVEDFAGVDVNQLH